MALTYEVGFRANTNELQSQLSRINTDIQNAFNLRNKGELGKEVERGVAAASALKTILQQATTNKGLSFISMNIALKQANISAAELVRNLSSAGMHNSVNSFIEAFTSADRTVLSLNAKLQEMNRVMTQSFKFSAAQQALRFFSGVFRDGIRWSKDMNEVLTEISIVSEKTGAALDNTMQSILDGAAALKVAAKEYAQAAVIFYQQGLADDEVERRTQTTIKAAKTSGAAVKDMSEQLTAVWNTYKMQNDELARAASQGARLGAETAVDFAYIAEAMQIAAVAASQMGVSYESLASIIATVGETSLQGASVVGNAFKTIFSRFQQLRSEGTDGEVTLGRVSQQLKDLGINALDTSGELRELDDIILETGNNWDKYSQKQQLAIAQVVGGTRQYGQFLSLMQNFDKYQKNLMSANSEIGSSSLESQYGIYLNSIESMANQASEAWAQAVGTMFDAKGLKAFYQMLRDIGNIVGDIIDGLGGFEGILGYIAAILMTKIGPAVQKIAITGRELWNNRNMAASIENTNKQYDQMIAKINQASAAKAQLNSRGQYQLLNSGAPINPSASSTENQYLITKLEISRQLTAVQAQLQKVQKDGTAVEKVLAEDLRNQLSTKQAIVNTSIDNIRAIERESEAQRKLNSEIAQQANASAQAAGRRAAVGTGGQKTSNAMFDAMSIANQAAVTAKGVYSQGELDKIASSLRKVANEARGLRGEPIDKLRESFRATANEITTKSKTVVQGLQQVQQAVREYNAAIEADPTKVNQLFGSAEAAANMEGSFERAANGVQELNDANEDLSASSDEANNLISTTTAGTFNFAQAMSTAAGSVAGFMISFQNLVTLFESGEASFTSILTSLLMFVPSTIAAVSSITSLVAAYTSVFAVKKLVTVMNATELSTEALLLAAKRAGIQLTAEEMALDAGALKIAIARKGAEMGLITAQIAENGVLAANTPITLANAAAWWAHPVVAVIAAVVLLAVAAFGAFNTMLKSNVEKTKATADATKESAEAIQSLTNEVRENTESVKENANAWIAVRQSGKDASEEYEKLKESLSSLNYTLIEAGGSQENLNKLMTEGLATGDLTDYYNEVSRIQNNLNQKAIEATASAQNAQLAANEAQMKKDNWKNSERTIGGDSSHIIGSDRSARQEIIFSDNMDEIISKYEIFEKEVSSAKINMNFDSIVDFKKSYEELIAAKQDMERSFTASELSGNDTYQDLIAIINELSESYVFLQEQAKIAMDTIQTSMEPVIGLMDVEEMTFTENVAAINAVTNAIQHQGEIAGLTQDQIEGLTRSVIASNPDLNKVLSLSDMANEMMYNLSDQSGSFKYNSVEEYQNAIVDLENTIDNWNSKADNHESGLFGVGEWFNSKSFDDEVQEMRDSADNFGEARKEMESEFERWQEFNKMRIDVLSFFDGLSSEDSDILLKIGVDNVSAINTIEEMGKKIDQYKDVTLRIKAEILNDPVSELEKINDFQKNMSNAVKEFTAEGNNISADTVQQLIALGPEYKRYLIETEDGYAMTTEGVKAYNDAIDKERELTSALLEATIKPNEALKEFAFNIADLAAVADSTILYDFANEVKDLTIDFVNGDIASEQFFGNLNTQLNNLLPKIDELNADDLQDFAVSLGELGASLATYHQTAVEAWQAGDIGATELRQALRDSASVALTSSKAVEKSLLNVESKMKLVTKGADGIYKPLEENSAEAKKFADELNTAAANTKNLESAISDLDLYEGLGQSFENSYEQLSALFSDDFQIKPELDTSQVESAINSLGPMFEEMTTWFSGLSSEMQQSVNEDLSQIVSDYYSGSSQVLANAQGLLNGTVAASELSQEELSNAMGAIATATSNSVTNTSSAIGEVMGGIADLIENFDYEVTVEPKGTIGIQLPNLASMTWKAFTGQVIPIKMNGDMSLGISGKSKSGGSTEAALSRIQNAATYFSNAGANLGGGGNKDIADVTDFLPKKDGLNAGDPNALKTDGGKKGGGGGGKDKDKQNELDEKQNFTERYRNINDTLKILNRNVEKLSESEDIAFGLGRIAVIQKKNKALQEEAAAYSKLNKEAKSYLTVNDKREGTLFNGKELTGKMGDQGRLNQMLTGFGLKEATFGKYGGVNDVENILTQLQEKYDISYRTLENALNGSEEAFKTIQERLGATSDVISQIIDQINLVESTANQAEQALAEGLAKIKEWMQNKITEVEYKVELRMSINDRDIRLIQQTLDQLGSRQYGALMSGWDEQTDQIVANSKELIAGAERYNEIMNNIKDPNMQDWFINGDGGKFKGFGQDAWDEYQKFGKVPADLMDAMLANVDQMIDLKDSFYEMNDKMWSVLHEALESYLSDFDNYLQRFDDHESILKSWNNIWKATGQQYKDTALSVDLLNRSIDNQQSKVLGLQQKYGLMTDSLKLAEEQYKLALDSQGADSKHTQESYEKWQQLLADTHSMEAEIASNIETMMSMIAEAAAESAAVIRKEFNEGFNGLFSDMNSAMDMYNQKKDIDNFYLHEDDLNFELDKMLRETAKDMENVTDPKILENYSKWMDKINGLKEDGTKMTQESLDILKAEFELDKMKAEFEEQQKAKNTMRLSRDTSGNWSYVYSNDAGEDTADKEAEIEEKINNIAKMHREAADAAAEMWLQLNKDLEEYTANIDWLRYENDMKYKEEVDQRLSWYNQQLNQNAGEVILHNEAIDRSFKDTTLGVITDMDSMEQANNDYKQNHEEMKEALKENHDEYQDKVKETLENVGYDEKELAGIIRDVSEDIMNENEQVGQSMEELRSRANENLNEIMSKVSEWSERWKNEIRSIIAEINALIAATQALARAQAGSADTDFDPYEDYTNSLQQGEAEGKDEAWMKKKETELYYKLKASFAEDLAAYNGDKDLMLKVQKEWNNSRYHEGMTLEEFLANKNYDTGGLVMGPQIAGLAVDGKKELVLNNTDTENFLQAISIMREGIASYLNNIGVRQAGTIAGTQSQDAPSQTSETPVIIQADFPNVTAREEIEAAFANLVNQAAQYKIKPRN